MNYFKSTYQPCSYSPNWYGTLDYAPNATVLMYDDENLFCIGTMDEIIDGVEYITEEQAINIINDSDGELVYKGDKLLHRWDVVEDG
jgi:hypothetical protein